MMRDTVPVKMAPTSSSVVILRMVSAAFSTPSLNRAGDNDGAVFGNVDLGFRVFLNLADDLTAGADHVANFLRDRS